MKISIVTICFNSSSTIRDTLESVLKQTYKNYEYLIIDGLSKDNTIDIVKEYEPKFEGRLKWISEKDKGLYDAMNKGVKKASGDIIGIINSDDVLANDHVFQDVIDNIGDNDGVYSNLLMLDETLTNPYRLLNYGNVKKRLAWHPPHPTLYLKREVYDKFGYFNDQLKIAADLDFMLRIIYGGVKLKLVDEIFVFMRAGGASTGGLKGYWKNLKESHGVLKNNHVKFPLFSNFWRILGVFKEKRLAKKYKRNNI